MDQQANQDQNPTGQTAAGAEQGGTAAAAAGGPGGARRNRGRFKLFAILALLAILLAGGLGYYWWARDRVSTDDAFVDGHIHTITPRVAGYVAQVLVDDNQKVEPGQTLVVLDPVDYQEAVAAARAELAEARATLASLELGVPLELSQTQQRVRGAKAELASLRENLAAARRDARAASQELDRAAALKRLAALELKRIRALRTKNAVAQARLDQARTSYQTALAQELAARDHKAAAAKKRDALLADLEKARAGIDLAATGQDLATIKSRHVEAQRARVELAQARLRQARLNLGYTQIKSPVRGRVTKKSVEPGRMVSRGQALLAVVPLSYRDLWITANYKETQLTRVRPGQPVSIEVDTYPGLKLTGKVGSIMAGTGAAFSLFPPENATGNYVKVVQRIPVKIVLDPPQASGAPVLRVGMSVIPTIFTNR